MFQPFQTLQYNSTNQLFASFILKISRFSAFFSTLFHCSSSKFTTTTAQFTFYNCKLHFTTAQIVISSTLKYALTWPTPLLLHKQSRPIALLLHFRVNGVQPTQAQSIQV